jgi:molybdopterin molybdotransferase
MSQQPFTPVADARAHILAACSPVRGTQRVPVRDALGRVLAADVISPVSVPPHDNSAMDGYAVRHADLSADGETRLTIVGQAFAGHGWAGEVAAGQAVRIMTGAVMPAGADTIVIQESARLDGDAVIVPPGPESQASTAAAPAKTCVPASPRFAPAGCCARPTSVWPPRWASPN